MLISTIFLSPLFNVSWIYYQIRRKEINEDFRYVITLIRLVNTVLVNTVDNRIPLFYSIFEVKRKGGDSIHIKIGLWLLA